MTHDRHMNLYLSLRDSVVDVVRPVINVDSANNQAALWRMMM